jgi:hypothetical protein
MGTIHFFGALAHIHIYCSDKRWQKENGEIHIFICDETYNCLLNAF